MAPQPKLAILLCENSGAVVEWLMDKFNLDVSLVARVGGHSAPRTYRDPHPCFDSDGEEDKARMITKARVTELIMSGGACLMNVWISARRNGDEDEGVFDTVFGRASIVHTTVFGRASVFFWSSDAVSGTVFR